MSRLARLLLVSASLAPLRAAVLTDRPIIGILTVPTSDGAEGCVTRRRRRLASDSSSPTATSSCFHSYYVDWLEAAGARVVAIPCTAPPALLDDLFDSVNGVLFTGGEESLASNSTYYGAARRLFDRAVAAAATGDRVPIWGSCMGFQLLCLLASGDDQSVLTRDEYASEGLMLPLDLVQPAASSSRLLGSASAADAAGDGAIRARVVDILASENVTVNFHHDGVDPARFADPASPLGAFFELLSTNTDADGRAFASTIEARGLADDATRSATPPIFGAQWHPERPPFEWTLHEPAPGITHTAHAILASQYAAAAFVAEARGNAHAFPSVDAENANLVYGATPMWLSDEYGSSEQVYVYDA